MPAAVRLRMESFFGTSLADVRVHVGAEAPSVGAAAFTHGSHIYFAPGHYQPATPCGQHLLAHELVHVLQQRAGRVRNPYGRGVVVVQDRQLEAEADVLAARAASHAPGDPPHRMPSRPGAASQAVVQPTLLGGIVGAATLGGLGLVTGGLGLAVAGLVVGGTIGHLITGSDARPAQTVPNTNQVFADDPVGQGGSYGQVRRFSVARQREADHTPPKSTYRGTPFAHMSETAMPAVSIEYGTHRVDQGGGQLPVTTTGSSETAVRYRTNVIRPLMAAGDFAGAMRESFKDQKNAAPNPVYYRAGQQKAAAYTHGRGLITEQQMHELYALSERVTR